MIGGGGGVELYLSVPVTTSGGGGGGILRQTSAAFELTETTGPHNMMGAWHGEVRAGAEALA